MFVDRRKPNKIKFPQSSFPELSNGGRATRLEGAMRKAKAQEIKSAL
jgi:hypothetical protein